MGSVAVLGAGSPANLDNTGPVSRGFHIGLREDVLVGHDHEKAFASISIRLKLIIRGMNASAAT